MGLDYGNKDAIAYYGSHVMEINELYGVTSEANDAHSITSWQDVYKFKSRIASGFVGIGCGWAQSTTCICVEPDDYGVVYYFAGIFEPRDKTGRPAPFRVAASFREFLE